MALPAVNGLSLCAGVGCLDLGLDLAFDALGARYRPVGYVERDAHAASVLVARMEDEALGEAPVWDDLVTFDGGLWRGRVDVISGGFPCQPFSAAGQKLGLDDPRWLWPHFARLIDECEPSLVFLENVPPFINRGLGAVLDDLASLGFDAEWSCHSASEVGAPHKRDRFWLLAYRDGVGLQGFGRQPAHDRHARHDAHRPGSAPLADPGGEGRPEVPRGAPGHEGPDGREPHAADVADGRGEDVADAEGQPGRGRPGERQAGRAQPQGGGLELWPPGPNDRDGWDRTTGPQPSVRRMADGPADRVDRLRACGNGVVPLVAASAFLGLAQRAGLIVKEEAAA